MQRRPLGKTDMQVSRLCLGTMTFGEQNTEAEAHEQLDRAIAADRAVERGLRVHVVLLRHQHVAVGLASQQARAISVNR